MIKRAAFTMVELVMVIVILGIVATIGTEIILKIYENYTRSRAVAALEIQTELVLDKVGKYLEHRIPATLSTTAIDGTARTTLVNGNPIVNQVLEWVGISQESNVVGRFGWGGIVDMNDSSVEAGNINISSVADFNNTVNTTIQAFIGVAGRPALFFKGERDIPLGSYYDGNTTFQATIGAAGIQTSRPVNVGGSAIYELFYIAHTAYAITPVIPAGGGVNRNFNLVLRYNYQPWQGETFLGVGTSTALLAENVSMFRFTQVGDVIRLKLCLRDQRVSTREDFVVCKEKAVL